MAKLKLAERASMTDGFKQAVRVLYENFLKTEKDKIEKMRPGDVSYYMQRHGGAIARIRGVLKSEEAWDLELTRLKGLSYSAYRVVRQPNETNEPNVYIVGTTRGVVIRDDSRSSRTSGMSWDMGAYDIYIPLSAFKNGSSSGIHFVPLRDPFGRNRHPHHKGDCYLIPEPACPTQMRPATCWGSFASIVNLSAAACDLPEMLRTLRTYVERYDAGSPLGAGITGCPFAQVIV
jgi:hypothetical protein